MQNASILGNSNLVAFIPTQDIAEARSFYETVLGITLVRQDAPFALVFDVNGTMLRVTAVSDYILDPFTVLGWQVDLIEATVDRLASAGVTMLRYAGMNENEPRGIWTSPAGARVAWFTDLDRNVLSVTEFPVAS